MPSIVFRVDASAEIGTGHLMRSITLADALKRRGLNCIFLCRHILSSQARDLAQQGHDLIELKKPNIGFRSANQYARWLGMDEMEDASEVLSELKKIPSQIIAIVVDHYGLGFGWEEKISESTLLPILAIDDLDRNHCSNWILDVTFGKRPMNYSRSETDIANLLIGTSYALLRPEFRRYRSQSLENRSKLKIPENILIAMGGADYHDLTGKLVTALLPSAAENKITLHVLTGAAYPHNQRLRKMVQENSQHVIHHHAISNVAALLSEIDFCVGAAGSSTWERCCLGVPTMNLTIAENQEQVADQITKTGAAVDGGAISFDYEGLQIGGYSVDTWVERQAQAVIDGQVDLPEMSRAAAKLVDGFGSIRVCKAIMSTLPKPQRICVDPVTLEDAQLLFEWQCFPGLRKFARDPNPPSWDAHSSWIARRAAEPEPSAFVVKADGIASGVLQLRDSDIGKDFGYTEAQEVSILIAPEMHGRGVAKAVLLLAIEESTTQLLAEISDENVASKSLFTSVGFQPIGEQYYAVH